MSLRETTMAERSTDDEDEGSGLICFGVPTLGPAEETAMLRVLRTGWIGNGPEVECLEREFAAATGARHAVAVSSCTASLHLSLLGAGVSPGDEVVTTALTFVATVNAISYTGAQPVPVDVDPGTLNIDPAAVEAAITDRTRAIVPVHFDGRPAAMSRLRSLAEKRGLAIVEDAAHAAGSRYRDGHAVGSGPSEACFSFYPNKNLTSCEGGMITTRSSERARRYRRLRNHGLSTDAWKRFGREEVVRSRQVELGFKYNLTDLQAALGRVQLERLEAFTRQRNDQAQRYQQAFADLERVSTIAPVREPERHAYHLFTIRLHDLPRERALSELRKRGVGAAIHYEPIHLHPYYRERLNIAPGSLPAAEEAGRNTLTLPIGPSLSPAQVECVIEGVRGLEELSREGTWRPSAGDGRRPRVSPGPCAPRPTTSPIGLRDGRR